MPDARQSSFVGYGALKSAALATGTSPVGSRGIHVNVAGTITGKLYEDTADGDYVVNAGQTYSYSFKSITSLGSATGRFLF